MPSPKRRQKTSDDGSLAGTLTTGGWKTWSDGVNALASGISGGRRTAKAKPGQASNLKASDYGNQKPYIAPGSNWDADKPKAKKSPKSSGLGGHKGS